MATKAKAKSSVMCVCIRDSREYPSDRFYEHRNTEIFPKGYIPYCKDCCNDMLQYYLKKTGTIEASMWYICALLDIPFIKRVFEKTQELNKDTDTIMVRFSMDSNSENYVSPEMLGKFCKIVEENGYNVIALPIEADVTIEK